MTGIELKRCLSVIDENGRFNPAYDANDIITLEADQVIVAIGQAVEPGPCRAYRRGHGAGLLQGGPRDASHLVDGRLRRRR